MPLNSQGISHAITSGHSLDPTRPAATPSRRGHHIHEFHARLGDEENYPELDVYNEDGSIDNVRMNQLMENTLVADDTRVFRSNTPPNAVHIHNPTTNVVIVMNPSNSGDLGTVFRADSPRYLEDKIRTERIAGSPPPRIRTGANAVENHITRFNVDLQRYPDSVALLQMRANQVGQPYQAPQPGPQAPAQPEAVEVTPAIDPESTEGRLSQRIEGDFGGVTADNIEVDGNDMIVIGADGQELIMSRTDAGNIKVNITDKFGQRTLENLSHSQAADFLADMGQRLGAAGGAALGLAAGITAFASGANASEAATIVVETSIPYGEAAVAAAQGDIEGAARASFSETAGAGGCLAGGWALGSWAAGLSIVTGPGAVIAGTVGGIVGCIGGAIGASLGAEATFDVFADNEQPLRSMDGAQTATIYEHIPEEIAEGMPPELEALIEMKRSIEQMKPESEAYELAMQEFQEFLGTDISAETANEIASYMHESKNNVELQSSATQPSILTPHLKLAENAM